MAPEVALYLYGVASGMGLALFLGAGYLRYHKPPPQDSRPIPTLRIDPADQLSPRELQARFNEELVRELGAKVLRCNMEHAVPRETSISAPPEEAP